MSESSLNINVANLMPALKYSRLTKPYGLFRFHAQFVEQHAAKETSPPYDMQYRE